MSNKKLFLLWGISFILCAGFGFIPQPDNLMKALLFLLSLAFFVPGSMLVYDAVKNRDAALLRCIRNISAASLILTLLLLVANFASVGASVAVGDFLYGLLVVVSAPMVCSQFWVVSLFLWACLLMVSISFLKKIKK